MKTMILSVALGASVFGAGAAAHAQDDNRWMVGIGVTQISPNVSSGNLTAPTAPGTQVDVDSDAKPSLWVTRMLTNHWSVEVPIAFGFKHEIAGAGAISGVGKIGTAKALPITVFAQYRFLEPDARFRPYAMAGLTYAYFYGERGSTTLNALNPINPPGGTGLSVDSKWAPALGIGATFAIDKTWFIDAQYGHSFLKTAAHLSSGQSISLKLNPDIFRIGVGLRF